ncbi:MAG: IPT/TIG domain-containing protein [Planctomycetes bacterium]|nr:IPT/TIG domain-containing protein [Planctomycetota bacterium]
MALSLMIGLATLFGCMPQADPTSLLDSVETLPGFKDGVLAIQSMTPTTGAVGRETIVLLRGEGFVPDMKVRFGEALSEQVIVYSDKMATAKVPNHAAGVVDVGLEALVAQANRKVGLSDAFTYFDPSGGGGEDGGGVDTDRDGLSDIKELEGWLIKVDPFGFGLDSRNTTNSGADVIVTYTVTSDPFIADTDDDGINDGVEFAIKTDPRNKDTDDDGLWDGEEYTRWLTSPVSVDTDGDARDADASSSFSTLPPNPRLFDGAELYDIDELLKDPSDRGDIKLRATSPRLADTDGDNVSDFKEITTPVRTPLLADMPQLLFEIVTTSTSAST